MIDFTREDEDEALAMAVDPLDKLRAQSDAVKHAVDEAGKTNSEAVPDGVREIPSLLSSCVDAQEYLVSLFENLRTQRNEARLSVDRYQQMLSVYKAERDSAVRASVDAVKKEDALFQSIKLVEEYFKREGLDKLATALYGKLSGEVFDGQHSGLVDLFSVSSKKWKPTWAVLRDNLLFFFKSGAVGKPTEVILVQPDAAPVPEEKVKHPHAFTVSGQTLAAAGDLEMWSWINKLNSANPWYQTKKLNKNITSALTPAASPMTVSVSSPSRRRGIFSKLFSVDDANKVRLMAQVSPANRNLSPGVSGNTALNVTRPVSGSADGRCGLGIPESGFPVSQNGRVFGVSISKAVSDDPAEGDAQVPAFLDVLVRDICQRGLEEEGILRVPGSHAEIEAIRKKFDQSSHARDVNLKQYDVLSLGGVMKSWLRDLPHSFFMCDSPHQQQIVEWTQSHPVLDEALATEFKDMLLKAMPPEHLAVLRVLSKLVLDITAHEEVNKMTTDNVLTCLLPSMKVPTVVFVRMVQNFHVIFPSNPGSTPKQ